MTQTQAIQNPLKEVLNYGQSIWFDGLVSPEEFRRMIREDGIRGATTNPTIFEKEISVRTWSQLTCPPGTRSEEDEEEVFKAIAVQSVQQLADIFLGVFQESKGQDGFVSIEVSPLLASNTRATIEEARELNARVGRKNVMIKVPATCEGIPAIETLIADGINVNVTLIFSIRRYEEVMEAYLTGLEKRSFRGLPVSDIASVASFFVSRVDTAVDKILEEKKLNNLLGKAAVANSKLAYQAFERVFSNSRFERLREKGARVQRPLWASTGTKNPSYSDVLYVESLIGRDTVNTLPPATLAAFREHGRPARRLGEGAEEARQVFRALHEHGIDLDAVTQKLEDAGVQAFSDSYKKTLEFLASKKK